MSSGTSAGALQRPHENSLCFTAAAFALAFGVPLAFCGGAGSLPLRWGGQHLLPLLSADLLCPAIVLVVAWIRCAITKKPCEAKLPCKQNKT